MLTLTTNVFKNWTVPKGEELHQVPAGALPRSRALLPETSFSEAQLTWMALTELRKFPCQKEKFSRERFSHTQGNSEAFEAPPKALPVTLRDEKPSPHDAPPHRSRTGTLRARALSSGTPGNSSARPDAASLQGGFSREGGSLSTGSSTSRAEWGTPHALPPLVTGTGRGGSRAFRTAPAAGQHWRRPGRRTKPPGKGEEHGAGATKRRGLPQPALASHGPPPGKPSLLPALLPPAVPVRRPRTSSGIAAPCMLRAAGAPRGRLAWAVPLPRPRRGGNSNPAPRPQRHGLEPPGRDFEQEGGVSHRGSGASPARRAPPPRAARARHPYVYSRCWVSPVATPPQRGITVHVTCAGSRVACGRRADLPPSCQNQAWRLAVAVRSSPPRGTQEADYWMRGPEVALWLVYWLSRASWGEGGFPPPLQTGMGGSPKWVGWCLWLGGRAVKIAYRYF